eukprot:8450028-Alexandrium_andersonii.AAC.1
MSRSNTGVGVSTTSQYPVALPLGPLVSWNRSFAIQQMMRGGRERGSASEKLPWSLGVFIHL